MKDCPECGKILRGKACSCGWKGQPNATCSSYEANRCSHGKEEFGKQCQMIGTIAITQDRQLCSWHHGLSHDKNNLGEFTEWVESHYPERDTPLPTDATERLKRRYKSPWINKSILDLWQTVNGICPV